MILPRTVPYPREPRERGAPSRAEGFSQPPRLPSLPSMTNLPNAPMTMPANTRMPTILGRGAAAYGRTREVAALVLWTLALFFALALASYQGDPSGSAGAVTPAGPDWVGPV